MVKCWTTIGEGFALQRRDAVMLATWRWEDITMDWRLGVNNLPSPDNCTLLHRSPGNAMCWCTEHRRHAAYQQCRGSHQDREGVRRTDGLTTVLAERGGFILKDIQDVFPDQKPINRTTLNTWEDKRVVDAIKNGTIFSGWALWHLSRM